MRTVSLTLGLAVIAAGALTNGTLAQQTSAAQMHMGHVSDGFRGTPDGQGLLPSALAEAKIAEQHAGLAARAPDNLDGMKTHTGHVLHAIDPSVETSGPGLGYGVKRAAAGVAQHITLAANAEGASDNVKTHATHVAAAANGAIARADQIIALAARIRAATSAGAAAPLVSQLHNLTQQLTAGVDANSDGRIGWQTEEGGLAQAQQHMELMKRGEGGERRP